ncbi:MAG TPA: prolipoprotein diacylglyceryl transferase [Sandaracinaceae bacterium LLY-WYZ-13_1]|nr:prolipoprotein diacylglyceryl transferase [Sandaracinaceae bacterium LLY-WYZ-13_1]
MASAVELATSPYAPALAALLIGVGGARRAGVPARRVTEALAVTGLACLALCRPVGFGIGWLTALASGTTARGWAHVDALGHASFCPAIVAALVLPVWWRLRRFGPVGPVLPLAVLVGTAGYALLKLACFADGCCFGEPAFGWTVVRFGPGTDAAAVLGTRCWVHPVQLYDAAASAIAAVGVWIGLGRARPVPLASAGAVALLGARVALEPLRFAYDRAPGWFGVPVLTENAVVCGLALLFVLGLLSLHLVRERKPIMNARILSLTALALALAGLTGCASEGATSDVRFTRGELAADDLHVAVPLRAGDAAGRDVVVRRDADGLEVAVFGVPMTAHPLAPGRYQLQPAGHEAAAAALWDRLEASAPLALDAQDTTGVTLDREAPIVLHVQHDRHGAVEAARLDFGVLVERAVVDRHATLAPELAAALDAGPVVPMDVSLRTPTFVDERHHPQAVALSCDNDDEPECSSDADCPSADRCIDGTCRGYDPCAGRSCGDTCTICAPDDPDCFETAVVKLCQPDGSCAPTVPEC